MDRPIVQAGESLRSADVLQGWRAAMVALARQASASLGSGTLLDGLPCTPGTGLTVSVGAGAVYSTAQVDATAYGSLTADTTHSVLKQGLLSDPLTLNCPAPGTSGQSINYLVEVQFQENDTTSTLVPFYNSANPTVPNYSNINTLRQGVCAVQIKAGTAAATGTQTTPAVDSGWTPAWVVTVDYGEGSLTTADIVAHPSAPFLGLKAREIAAMYPIWADTGSANALVVTPTPAFAALPTGVELSVTPANANTGATTLNVNGLGAAAVQNPDGSALRSGQVVPGRLMRLKYNGTAWVWLNSPTSPTQGAGDNSTSNATTAYADAGDAATLATAEAYTNTQVAGANSSGPFIWQQQGF